MIDQAAPIPTRRICGVIETVKANQGVWLSPLQKDSRDQVWIAMAEIKEVAGRRVRVGAWIECDLLLASESPIGVRGEIIQPTPLQRQARLCERYSATPSMAGGVNPRSHRLDGLTYGEAQRLLRSGRMSPRDWYLNMSENGLQQHLNRAGLDGLVGDRESIVRQLLEQLGVGRQ
jgi:hypothetical protein